MEKRDDELPVSGGMFDLISKMWNIFWVASS